MRIHIPTPLRPYVDQQTVVEVAGGSVAEGLANLTAKHAALRRHLFTEEGKLRAFVNVYVNDEDIRYLDQQNTLVKEGDVLSIVPSIAGGVELTIVD